MTRIGRQDADVIVGQLEGRAHRHGATRSARTATTAPSCSAAARRWRAIPSAAATDYRPLLVEIVKFFETGKPPVPNEETLEMFAFMDAAQRSKEQGGKPVTLR